MSSAAPTPAIKITAAKTTGSGAECRNAPGQKQDDADGHDGRYHDRNAAALRRRYLVRRTRVWPRQRVAREQWTQNHDQQHTKQRCEWQDYRAGRDGREGPNRSAHVAKLSKAGLKPSTAIMLPYRKNRIQLRKIRCPTTAEACPLRVPTSQRNGRSDLPRVALLRWSSVDQVQ